MKKILTLSLIIFAAINLHSLELESGNIKLVIDETTCAFEIYYNVGLYKTEYKSLLNKADMRTSYATLSFDKKFYRLGDSTEFTHRVFEMGNGAAIEYSSRFCIITQAFLFEKSTKAELNDSVRIVFSIKNILQEDVFVGMRFLLDTYLGEKSSAPILMQNDKSINTETLMRDSSIPTWLLSSDDKAALYIQIASPATTPDSISVANSKKLNEIAWMPNTARNPDLMPYSLSDSAVAMFFEPKKLVASSQDEITIILTGAKSNLPAKSVQTSSADIANVKNLLERINTAIEKGAMPSEIDAIETELQKLVSNNM